MGEKELNERSRERNFVETALRLHLVLLLRCRIDDLEDVVNINERLNQQLHQKDERITVLQTKYVLL